LKNSVKNHVKLPTLKKAKALEDTKEVHYIHSQNTAPRAATVVQTVETSQSLNTESQNGRGWKGPLWVI